MKKIVGWASLFGAVLLLCGSLADSPAQEIGESKVNINALVQETKKTVQKADEMTLVWWIPEEFWNVTFAQDPTVTKAQAEEFIKVLRPYTLIVIVDGKMGGSAGVTYRTEADIRTDLQLKDSHGTFYRPFSKDKINADVKNALAMMKPVFVNILEPLGQDMHFFVFPAKSENGRNIADARKKGAFSVKLGKREFKWRLPLGSLLSPKICPKCRENCSGAWNFCPWCGTKLPEQNR